MNILEIFINLINRSITAGIVILAVLAVRELMRRIGVPRRYIYLLWIIPALRLLCPVSPSSAVSLFNLPVFDRAVQTQAGLEYLPEELSGMAAAGEQPQEGSTDIRPGSYGMSRVRRDVGEAANYYGGQVFDLSGQESRREDGLYGEEFRWSDSLYGEVSRQGDGLYGEIFRQEDSLCRAVSWREDGLYGEGWRPAAETYVNPRRLALQVLAGIWLVGMAAILARHLWSYLTIRRKTACAARLPGGPGDVYECEGIRSPFAMGLLRGRIYIPYHMPEKEREYILLHERYHIRHRDLWVRLLACLLQAVYWYNPLVWAAVRCMERDMEMRCDEYVLSRLGGEVRYDYSLSLLSYATGHSYQPQGTTAFGESGTGKRVNHVLQYKKTGICVAILAVLAIAIISAVCLTDRSPREDSGEQKETAEVEKTYFWGQQELKIELSGDVSAPAMFLVGRSVLSLPPEAEGGTYGRSMCCVGEHCYFRVRPLYMEDAEVYELQIFDGDRKEWSSGVLAPELLGQGSIYDIFAASDQELVYLIIAMDSGGQYSSYQAVHVNRAGEELKRVELLPVCLEQDMIRQNVPPTNICVDSEGNYYIISFDGKKMIILDGEGQYQDSRDCGIQYKHIIPWMTAGPDGGILTQGYSETDDMEWMWLEGAREKSLGGAKGAVFSDRLIPLDNGRYYYITADKKIYQGDETTGNAEFLFDAGRIIGTWGEVAVNGGGEVLLFAEKKDRAVAYVLNRAKETQMGDGGESIAVTDPLYATDISWRWSGELESSLPMFMADHPEYAFDVQPVPYEERSAARDRVWNELIAGEGPDIFCIDAEDLPALWEKGILMDLRELVSQETLDQIYPGLLSTGTIGGSLAGVSTWYNIHSMVTSTDIWPGEQWTVEDIVDMLETGRFPYAIDRWSSDGYASAGAIVYTLACGNMADSPFIDWEAGTCSFDSELFLRLLKAAKQYGYDGNADMEDVVWDDQMRYRHLLEGQCLAVDDIICDRMEYAQMRLAMGERYNQPGLPGAAGSGQVVDPLAYIVVNKNCVNREAAAAYLEFMLSADNIPDYRRDCRETFEVAKDWEGKWSIKSESIDGGTSIQHLLDEKDPELLSPQMPEIYVNYLQYCEDYYAYMEDLEGQYIWDRQIHAIISEEVENYFQGSQSAEHVADVIQRRVKLYLSERQ